ncbi:iron chaperone [Pseudolysinimonas sp.]|jgi:uncharacterized protein YdhG (YjbR/CyaY superfamily)|uniref:iron chaperone n=1 Tax=Pseudolysinimonas sp. TaxID=2680009 RepID=UPI003783E3AE
MGEYSSYISGLSKASAVTVETFRTRALELVPDADEGVSYGMPALRYRGRPLISVVHTQRGYSAYPFSADVVASTLPLATGLAATKGAIRFTDADPLSTAAFDHLVRARQAEIDAALGPVRS